MDALMRNLDFVRHTDIAITFFLAERFSTFWTFLNRNYMLHILSFGDVSICVLVWVLLQKVLHLGHITDKSGLMRTKRVCVHNLCQRLYYIELVCNVSWFRMNPDRNYYILKVLSVQAHFRQILKNADKSHNEGFLPS